MRRTLAIFASAASTWLAVSVAVATPQDMFSVGPRSIAMGGTGVACGDDWSATYTNPALLSRVHVGHLALGYEANTFQTWIAEGNQPGQHVPLDAARGVVLGLALPIQLPHPIDDRIVLGVALHLPTQVIGRNIILRPETPQFVLLQNRAQAIGLIGGAGVRLPYGFRIGGCAAALSTLGGSLVVGADSSGDIAWQIDDRIVVTYAPFAGLSWEHGPFSIGLTGRMELVGGLDVVIQAHDLGITLPPFNVSGVPQYDPKQLALEAAFSPGGWTFALGATYKLWSEYPGPLMATTPASPAPPPTNFSNTFVFRAGVEHRWDWTTSHAALRAGYFYEPTPAPEATGVPNLLDNDRHVATLGGAISGTFRGSTLTLDVYSQLHILATRTNTKDPTVPMGSPGTPSITSGGTMLFIGASLTVSL